MDARTLSLNGTWEVGIDRQYDGTASVPGLATDPAQVTPGALWYRRRVTLPAGDWTAATLILNGARFCPAVYVNGVQVSAVEGGMTRTQHLLASPDVRPGATITLEIALQSLDEVPADDASRIPNADRWRSNIASCLWDGVTLRVHGGERLTRIIPGKVTSARELVVRWECEVLEPAEPRRLVHVSIAGASACEVTEATSGSITLRLPPSITDWSPVAPHLYRVTVRLSSFWVRDKSDVVCLGEPQPQMLWEVRDGTVLDEVTFDWAPRDFRIVGKGFRLNGKPVTFRAGSVVWHRWVRDVEGRELAWDAAWFEEHIVKRLKAHGANGLRFHLGMPPEALLDLCDRHGLLVQVEWSFFHGMAASGESLRRQWRDWFDLLMRHPCVAIIHPWNETEGDQLATAFEAIDAIACEYPPLVISHRDVLHVHKYWWSLFENVGVYYDSADQFPQPVVADEFGGNYLDGDGNPGGYPTLKESYLRFLGRGHTAELRLQLQAEANARVAEYWRRLDVAGFSPFCILGSWEDGNHHFLGPLREGNPKPVWDALTAAYSPASASLDIWDRNFTPGQTVEALLHLFNETPRTRTLDVSLRIEGAEGEVRLSRSLRPFAHEVETVTFALPDAEGEWRMAAEVGAPSPPTPLPITGKGSSMIGDGNRSAVPRPLPPSPVIGRGAGGEGPLITSSWRVRTLVPRTLERLTGAAIAVPEDEAELRAMLSAAGLDVCAPGDSRARVLLAGRATWERGDWSPVEAALTRGTGAVLLDIGPRELGQGYLEGGDLGPLQGAMHIAQPATVDVPLFWGLTARFREMPEPESCLHPAPDDDSLWAGLDRQATWLWNGYRGGLIVPARDLELVGLSPDAFLALWAGRGADTRAIQAGGAVGYELAGFYAFSDGRSDAVRDDLRRRVQFLVDDAPALAAAINPNAPIAEHDLSTEYRHSTGRATALIPLANAGKNLARTPVAAVRFGAGEGTLVVSQLLTQGRLAPGFGTPGLYGIRHDPAAVQVVLNMLARAAAP